MQRGRGGLRRERCVLWCWEVRLEPRQIGDETDWTLVSPSCGVRGETGLWCELRHGTPELVSPDQWLTVAAAQEHQCAVGADGGLWCRGTNGSGAMGHGDSWRERPTQVYGSSSP